jgi:acyl dehydratase
MKIDSGIVGTELAGLERDVTWRDTMNYAAAVGDANPRYLDDTLEDGIMAPPLFAVAVTWPFIENVQETLQGVVLPEIVMTMVHATEHLVFHRPVRPGTRLRVSGRVAAVVPSAKGTLLVLKLQAADPEGRKIFTEYGGAVFRGVGCSDAGRGGETLPERPSWEIPDAPLWERKIPISAEAAHVYDGCSGIVFPIHTSRSFARSVGLPDIILQGTATLALAAREIVNREAGGDPCGLREIACRFTGMVLTGTSIRVQLLNREEDGDGKRVGFRVLDAEGRPAIRDGFARIA